ncbi:hypothetical protein T36_0510 [Helicobacter cinaedi]|uniref:hypothetical protein n=1 Tax=Helicobacter cinaedi TaxID=213 RepID=UPI001F16A457|nr:hypothetical protein [Helicobacter cinaedi]BDB64063.1 hypothetical protein T36_0510 [Helicobacter cinaedi]
MRKILLLLALIASYLQAYVCNYDTKTQNYTQWQEHYDGYQWGTNAIGNRAYIQESFYTIVEMMLKCDMKGLELIAKSLGEKEFARLQEFQGDLIYSALQGEDVPPPPIEPIEFLLKHKLASVSKQGLSATDTPLELTTQKLKEAKSKGDSKAIANYEKILELLQKYGINE